MKKTLLTLASLLAISLSSFADDVTFDFTKPATLTPAYSATAGSNTDSSNTYETVTGVEFTDDFASVTATKGNSTDARLYYQSTGAIQLRVYNGATLTINSTEPITSIVFVFNSTSSAFTNNNITYNSNNTTFEANGVVKTVEFKCTANSQIKTITVYTGEDKPDVPEAPEGIITVAEAIDLISKGYTGSAQVSGIITSVTDCSTTYNNATFIIKDSSEDTTTGLTIYRTKWINGGNIESEDQIEVGGTVSVEGTLKLYGSTNELTDGTILEYTAPAGDDNGDDNGDDDGDDEPTVGETVTQNFNTGLGLPDGSSNAPTEATQYTATDTNITYTIYGCYMNSGYMMMPGKTTEGSLIEWTLDFDCVQLQLTTPGGSSTNDLNAVSVYADGEIIANGLKVNQVNTTYKVDIPEDYQKAGTVYKVQTTTTKYNTQFASFTYVKAADGSSAIADIAADEAEATAEYFNLQGQRVANPAAGGIYIVRQGSKVSKVIL